MYEDATLANANLIAAAPDMLEALTSIAIMAYQNQPTAKTIREIGSLAEEIIAKSEGKA